MSARTARPRRARGAAESLASIVLGFESIVVFLGGLVVYGLDALTPLEPWWGIVAGTTLAALMIVTAGLARYRWGIALGWLWQLVLLLGGFRLPALALVGIIFGAMYAYATIKGASLDRRNAGRAGPEPRNGDA